MKLELALSKNQVELFYSLIKQWKDLAPKPLTNFVRLKELESQLGLQVAYLMLSGDCLEKLEFDMMTNPVSEGIE